jgi:hypothetical protein
MSSIARICKEKPVITKHDKFLTFSFQLGYLVFTPDVIIIISSYQRYDKNYSQFNKKQNKITGVIQVPVRSYVPVLMS